MLDKFWVYDVNVFYETVNSSQKKLNRLLRLLWHCALRTICGCRFFQIVAFFDFGNCWFEISVYFIHIFHLLPWCDTWATVPLQVISKLSYNRPRCVRNGVVPDNSVMSYTFPAAVSFTNIVSPTVQIPCGWTKVHLFCSPTFISSLTTSHLNPYYLVDWVIYFDLISSRTCKGQTVSTRLISKQELVLFFNSISTGPPSKEKENKPLTVVGHLQKRNKLTGHKQPAILLQLYLLDIQPI